MSKKPRNTSPESKGGYTNNFAEYYKFIPAGLVLYIQQEYLDNNHNSNINFSELFGTEKTTYHGEITFHSQRRMSKCLQLLLDIAEPKWMTNPQTNKRFKFKLAFQTLTLSSIQDPYTDKEIKKYLLEPYLRIMRRKGMKNYVWKSELQKNGNIHFHILTDTFILYSEIRDIWNNLQSKYHFITNFENKYGHRDPNSTDVKAVTRDNETLAYLKKYMLKKSDKTNQLKTNIEYLEKTKGKVWDCSQNLKIPNRSADFLTDELWRIILHHSQSKTIRGIEDDYYKLYFFDKSKRSQLFPDHFTKKYNEYINSVKSFEHKSDVNPKPIIYENDNFEVHEPSLY